MKAADANTDVLHTTKEEEGCVCNHEPSGQGPHDHTSVA